MSEFERLIRNLQKALHDQHGDRKRRQVNCHGRTLAGREKSLWSVSTRYAPPSHADDAMSFGGRWRSAWQQRWVTAGMRHRPHVFDRQAAVTDEKPDAHAGGASYRTASLGSGPMGDRFANPR